MAAKYGVEGIGFTRMNIAAPRAEIEKSLARLLFAATKTRFCEMKDKKSIQDQIERYFLNCEIELVDTLSRLVAVKSIREDALPGMPFGKGPAEALALSLKMADAMCFTTHNYDNYVGTIDLNTQETLLGILLPS